MKQRQDALEFAQSVARAIYWGSGNNDAQVVIDVNVIRLDEYVVDADRREAALREALAGEFTQEETARLLMLRPEADEPRRFARVILTAATRLVSRKRGNIINRAGHVTFLFQQILRFLEPKSSREDTERRRQPATH